MSELYWLSHRILLGNLPRCNRHLLAMSPEPKRMPLSSV